MAPATRTRRTEGGPAAPRRSAWPGTPAERADRERVLDAVRRVGRERLRFTIDDVRRDLVALPQRGLAHPGQLARHVWALEPITLVSVGQPHATHAAGVSDGDGNAPSRGRRMRHLFALAERLAEHARVPHEYPDPVRVYLALWVASLACGNEPVATQAVTKVCELIDPLHLRGEGQTTTRLANLACGPCPLVEVVRDGRGSLNPRWRRWRPLGARPAEPRLDAWVAYVQAAADGDRDLRHVAGRTAHDIMAELVGIAIEHSKSRHWPGGRAVTVEDLRAACAEDERARACADELEARGTTWGRVLGDATKTSISGRRRVVRQVVKVSAAVGRRTYYDVPGLPGHETRVLFPAIEALTSALQPWALEPLELELRAARALVASPVAAVRAIGRVRVLFVHRELVALEGAAEALQATASRLREPVQKQLAQCVQELAAVRRRFGESEEAELAAEAAAVAAGVRLPALLEAPRPLLVGEELAAWCPRDYRGQRTGAELVARFSTLRRFLNPDRTRRHDTDARRAATTAVDRVDALVHVAERLGAATLSFLGDGARLLGRDYRDATLPRTLLAAPHGQLWSPALAALALLGDSAAETEAWSVLGDRAAAPRRLLHAVYALCVMRRFRRASLPAWVVQGASAELTRALRRAIRAEQTGEWLLS